MKNFHEWLDYIQEKRVHEARRTLERVRSIAEKLQLLPLPCHTILIGGTNGKGSTVKLCESIYQAAGYRTTAYTSPHFLRFTERLRLNSEESNETDWVAAFAVVDAEVSRQQLPLTYFEYAVLGAFWIIQQYQPDVALIEVGLGGRLDTTNILDPDCSVITSIGMDHMDRLGDTLALIAGEKAGIFRANRPAICGEPNPPNTLLEKAKVLHSDLFQQGEQFAYELSEKTWSYRDIHGRLWSDLPLPILLPQNVSTAIAAVQTMQTYLPLDETLMWNAALQASLDGRFERAEYRGAQIIFDVAHNVPAAENLVNHLKMQKGTLGKVRAVFAILEDKDIQGVIQAADLVVDSWYSAALDVHRGLNAEKIQSIMKTASTKTCYNFESVGQALQAALAKCQTNECIVVFGSFYTVAAAKTWLQQRGLD